MQVILKGSDVTGIITDVTVEQNISAAGKSAAVTALYPPQGLLSAQDQSGLRRHRFHRARRGDAV